MPPGVEDPADTVAALTRAVPGVAGLHAGMFGEVATYLPGRRVSGIRFTDMGLEVHIVVWADAPVRRTATLVREAVAAAVPGVPVDVTVEDITTLDRPTAAADVG
ncbi:hypothetical protein AB0K11_00165 [Mycobacterium sp. NPDC050551]|uniref:hypothetical protein n=1 Tax=Mycobacterium sp. NPDC050551 TaxID=3155407 RepID=UPI0034286087